jgi:hypothetical protein
MRFYSQIEKSKTSAIYILIMQSFDLEHFKMINTIIERDSKDTTYKYALLRAVVEISQEYPHLRHEKGDRVEFPLGLLVDKWLLYYYPLIASRDFLPQLHGEKPDSFHKRITFRPYFKEVTDYYAGRGGFSVFYDNYVNGSIPSEISPLFRELLGKIKSTITSMPMKHFGRSKENRDYSIFQYNKDARRIPAEIPVSQESIVHTYGTFSFPKDLFIIFQYLGSFIAGDDSLVSQWAEFTSKASGGSVAIAPVIEVLRTVPETCRAVDEARAIYLTLFQEYHSIECVWSGKSIDDFAQVHVDHMIPFSIWKNNNLWNLLPALESENVKKRNRIPSPALITGRANAIVAYWECLYSVNPNRFSREINLALTGSRDLSSDWQQIAIERLKEKCRYLIEVRGYDAWNPKK